MKYNQKCVKVAQLFVIEIVILNKNNILYQLHMDYKRHQKCKEQIVPLIRLNIMELSNMFHMLAECISPPEWINDAEWFL